MSILLNANRHVFERSAVNMKTTNSLSISDRYTDRERPGYLVELIALGIVLIALTLLTTAMAVPLK